MSLHFIIEIQKVLGFTTSSCARRWALTINGPYSVVFCSISLAYYSIYTEQYNYRAEVMDEVRVVTTIATTAVMHYPPRRNNRTVYAQLVYSNTLILYSIIRRHWVLEITVVRYRFVFL